MNNVGNFENKLFSLLDMSETIEVEKLKKELADVKQERDQLQTALNLADALRNRERANNADFLRVSPSMPARSDVYAEAKRQLGLKVK